MSEGLPKVTQLGPVTNAGLDAVKLVEAAKSKLEFARSRLDEIKRAHRLKAAEIESVYAERLQAAEVERDEALRSLNEQTKQQAGPAQEMIQLVQRMLG